MLLLEFLCCTYSLDLINGHTEDTYLVGVLLDQEAECVAYELAARELWSRGFIVLRVRAVSRWKHKGHSCSKLLEKMWDRAELAGISVLVTETSVRFGGSKIRGHAPEPGEAWTESVSIAPTMVLKSVDDHSLV